MILCRPVHTPDDCMCVSRLAHEIWHEHYTPIVGEEQVRYMLEKFQSPAAIAQQIADGYTYLLGEETDHDTPVGYAAFTVQTEERALFLSKLYILRAARGKGYAHVFLDEIVAHALRHDATAITLTVNKNNTQTIAAYKKCGFDITGTCVTDIGNGFVMDDYCMKKDLIPPS